MSKELDESLKKLELKEPSPEEKEIWQKTRKSLIERLNNWEDQKTWNEFYQTYWRLIYSVATKSGLTREEAFDVVQETTIAIAKQVQTGQFKSGQGSFKAWLMQMARWRILDVFRSRKRKPSMSDLKFFEEDSDEGEYRLNQFALEQESQLEQLWDKEWRDNLLNAALERVKAKVSPKQFQIFDCYLLKGWSIHKTAETLGVKITYIYLTKHRIGIMVKKELDELKKHMK
jgi:RNA polymerase sigma factor (sigma-70 family)